ncbi:putative proteinral secretion pathway protein GspM [Pseudomonas savastanoi pv. glycinea]|nr:putative proteinral secretion pathway protein GspM [Pseudomonas savastanoi pv. glycinea]
MSSRMWQPYVDRWRRLSGRVRVARAGLSIRETRLLSIGALVLCCLVTWLLMVQPALKKITYWQAQNPVLSAQAETLETLLKQVRVPQRRTGPQDLQPALQRSLEAFGLWSYCQLEQDGEGAEHRWQLAFDHAPADAVIGWLLEQPQLFSLHIKDASLQRAGEDAQDLTGHLSGVVRMDQAPSAKEA